MDVEPDRTALLVLDYQHDIVSEEGKLGSQGLGAEVSAAGAIPATARALRAARDTGLTIAHVGNSVGAGQAVNMSAGLIAGLVALEALQQGSAGTEFVAEVAPADGEMVVMKSTVSALAGTPLDSHLRNSDICHLVLAGVATNMVVEGTARHAVDLGYQVTILRDACASFSPDMHDFALEVLSHLASVATVDEFVAALP